jgi:transcription elongation factor GreA
VNEIKKRLATELKALEREFRIELPKEIKTAVAMGDLRENAEYHAALERQSYVKARIGQLRERLAALNSLSLDQLPRDRVGLGSKVTLLDLDNGTEVGYTLVVSEVADLGRGLISVASPIGSSLLNKQEGEEVTIRTPSGDRRFELLSLITAHGANGA